jgi:enoyl-CoA hydratase/carnithine racemase
MTVLQNEAAEITREDGILWLRIARPPNNYLVTPVFDALHEAMELIETGEDRVLAITGTGQVFSKGFDLGLMHSCPDRKQLRVNLVHTNAIFSRVARSPKPVVAAINGHCLGGGFELALCCHFRVCKEKVRLGLPEVWLGMVPGLGGIHRLVRQVGMSKALELIAFGDLFAAEDALHFGLANRVYPKDTFEADARRFAKTLATLDPAITERLIRVCRAALPGNDEDNIVGGFEAFRDLAPWLNRPPAEKNPASPSAEP